MVKEGGDLHMQMTIVPILVRCPSNMGQQKDAQAAREIVIYSILAEKRTTMLVKSKPWVDNVV